MPSVLEFMHNYAPQNGWGTFLTAAFGAFAGAIAASRAHNKRTIIAELNALNAAHELSIAIANIILAIKRQHVVPLKDEFERIRIDYANHQTMVKTRTQFTPFHFIADMRSLALPATPHAALEKMVFEKTLIRGRALAALVTLIGAIDALGVAIKTRNEMVDERRTAEWKDQERLEFFLGLRSSTGIIDERFTTNIAAISTLTDDCIFFAATLATDLRGYANKLRWTESWFYRLRVPRIEDPNWSYPEKIGLMPKEGEYINWLRGFQSKPTRLQKLTIFLRLKKSSS